MSDTQSNTAGHNLPDWQKNIPEGITYPSWLYRTLHKLFENTPWDENSYYGPINTIFSSMFPGEDNFLVNPQDVLHPLDVSVSSTTLPPGTPPHPDATRASSRIAGQANQPASTSYTHNPNQSSVTSVDSFDAKIRSRKVFSDGGSGNLIPDFVISRKLVDTTFKDVILCLHEVKNNDINKSQENDAFTKMILYLEAVEGRAHDQNFVGFLTVGKRCYVYKAPIRNKETGRINQYVDVIETGGPKWVKLLEPLQRA